MLGVELQVLPASSGRDIEALFSTLSERRLAGLVMSSDPLLGSLARSGGSPCGSSRHTRD